MGRLKRLSEERDENWKKVKNVRVVDEDNRLMILKINEPAYAILTHLPQKNLVVDGNNNNVVIIIIHLIWSFDLSSHVMIFHN